MSTIVLTAVESEEGRRALDGVLRAAPDAVEWVDLSKLDFGPCLACGGCEESPRCVLKDEFSAIVPRLAACSRLILVTPIFLGVHHPLMKRVVDRFMPLGGGPFTVRKGEMHHESRMEKPFSLTLIGLLDADAAPEEANTFRLLASRHAVNLDCPSHEAHVVGSMNEVAETLTGVLSHPGGAR